MNCSVLSQLPSKGSGSDALAFLVGWPQANICVLVRMVRATANAAWEAALAMSSGHPLLGSVSHSWSLGVVQQVATSCGKVSHRNGPFGPRESQYSSGSWWDMADA